MPQLNIDCEGPITQNDNAYELCRAMIPKGGNFFTRVSRYDDFLADIEKRRGYKAGDTLKLILPFLKAFGATNKKMEEFSEKSLLLLPGAGPMLQKVVDLMPTFIISTSYSPYLDALCKATGFPENQVYSTSVDIDRYKLTEEEEDRLRQLGSEIASQPIISWSEGTRNIGDLGNRYQALIGRLDEIFWKEIPEMDIGRVLFDVNPVGGPEKARAVRDSLKKTGLSMSDVLYVGDSITDVQALEAVRDAGGASISFNGNRYSIRAAKWACMSGSAAVIGAIAQLLGLSGMDALDELAIEMANGTGLLDALASTAVESEFIDPLRPLRHEMAPRLVRISSSNISDIIRDSEYIRKNIRGVGVGELG
ncbi:MAG: hypothetical protein GWP10_00345 [Nitrospiraceae bacterium]|nr:hypothetical protein [Nitrospiraceae bacterium]